MQNYSTKQKMKEFFTKYSYLFILSIGVGLLLLVIILSTTAKKNTVIKDDNNNISEVSSQLVFALPMLDASIYKDYNGSGLLYNQTLKQWEAHKSIDFLANSNSNVYAVMDGVVKDIYSNYLEGTVVVLEHNNGMQTTYGSLAEDVNVKIGDSVSKGVILGKASESGCRECGIGAYLHFTTYDESGNKIDPSAYLNISSK